MLEIRVARHGQHPVGLCDWLECRNHHNAVSIDNHISAVSDGANVYIAMKDHNDAVWLEKGSPGNWQAPVKVVNGGTDVPANHTSRPTWFSTIATTSYMSCIRRV